MFNQNSTSNNQRGFDLVERTALIGEKIIDFCKSIKLTPITSSLVNQLIRAGAGIGANYSEASEANSKKDFKNKIVIAKKEAKETMHWLRMVVRAAPEKKEGARSIYKEVHELVLIFSAIMKK